MAYLTDEQLVAALEAGEFVIDPDPRNAGTGQANSLIQPCSIDLRVGGIFVPGTEAGKPGSAGSPKQIHSLQTGQTAIVTTKERLRLGRRIAVVGFPPARVASRGLFMLNPGHVDPGFDGYLRFTVLNMGKDPIALESGSLIFTALFSRLGQDVQSDYAARNPGLAGVMPGAEEVDRLTRDFLDFERRVDARIDKADQKFKYFGIVTPITVAAVTWIVTQVSGCLNVSDLKVKVEKLEALDRDALRLKRIEDLSDRIDRLEKAGPATPPLASPPVPAGPSSTPKGTP
jgi:deoxycytidine triphosphate deaminase